MVKYTFHTRSIFIHIAVIFGLLILLSCTDEYDAHYRSEFGDHFAGDAFSGNEELTHADVWVLPDIQVKQELLTLIGQAEKRIWIEIYTWTDKDVLTAVIEAHNRGVDVRIILEPSVYGTPTINKVVYTTLLAKDIPVAYADGNRYTFTHAKFFIIDDVFLISTGNLTHSHFTKNRDLILKAGGEGISAFLRELFLRDFQHLGTNDLIPPERLVISPIDSREKIANLIASGREKIIIYNQTLSDPEIINLLSRKSREGVLVEICTTQSEANTSSSLEVELNWQKIGNPYPHIKLILIDKDALFIGSENLTTNSLDNNREIGIIIRGNTELFGKLMQIYQDDCHSSL